MAKLLGLLVYLVGTRDSEVNQVKAIDYTPKEGGSPQVANQPERVILNHLFRTQVRRLLHSDNSLYKYSEKKLLRPRRLSGILKGSEEVTMEIMNLDAKILDILAKAGFDPKQILRRSN